MRSIFNSLAELPLRSQRAAGVELNDHPLCRTAQLAIDNFIQTIHYRVSSK